MIRPTLTALACAAALPLPAAADEACGEVAGILTEAVEVWPDLLSTRRVKPRMAAVKIGSAAGIAVNYANDAGWTEVEKAPIIALRDTRERSMEDPAYTKDKVPAVLHGYLVEIAEMLAGKCPDTEIADVSDLSTTYPAR